MRHWWTRGALVALGGAWLSACATPMYPARQAVPPPVAAPQPPPPPAPESPPVRTAPPETPKPPKADGIVASPSAHVETQALPPVAKPPARPEATQPAAPPPVAPTPAPPPPAKPKPAPKPAPAPVVPPPPPPAPLRTGAKGKVQDGSKTPRTIEVERHDTVNSISERVRADPKTVIKLNKLKKPYALKPGQALKIPSDKVYVVQAHDSLFAVSRRFGVDVASIMLVNGFEPGSKIHPGQKVGLPELIKDESAPVVLPTPPEPKPAKTKAKPKTPSAAAPPVVTPPPLEPVPVPTPAPEPAVAQPKPAPVPAPSPAPPVAKPSPVPAPTVTQPKSLPAPNLATPKPLAVPPPPRPVAAMPISPGLAVPEPSAAAPASASPAVPGIGPIPPRPTDTEAIAAGHGKFLWPLRGEIISAYGPKPGGQSNDGINIKASLGDPIHASAAGEVVYAGDLVPGFGQLVLIKHAGGFVTAYAHMSKTLVKMKERVMAYQQIGEAGDTGGVPGTQLHFEIRYAPTQREKARPVDPALLLPGR